METERKSQEQLKPSAAERSIASPALTPTVAETEQRRDELGCSFTERLATLESEQRATEVALKEVEAVPAAMTLIERREALTREIEATRHVRRVLLGRAEADYGRACAIEAERGKIAALEKALPHERAADERDGDSRPTPTREARVLALLASCRERIAGYEAGDVPIGRPL